MNSVSTNEGCACCNGRPVKACLVCLLDLCERERVCPECGNEELIYLEYLRRSHESN